MKYYSIDEQANEVLIGTLRQFDYLDAVTPSYPKFSIITDVELPKLVEKQALVVMGERTSYQYKKNGIDITINNVFLVSKNISIVEDHRGEQYYSTLDGSKVEIKELGALPDNVTDQPKPEGFYIWSGNTWIEDQGAKDEATKQENILKIEYEQLRTETEIKIYERMRDRGRADEDDLKMLEVLEDYSIDLKKVMKQKGWPLEVDWPQAPEF